MFKLRMSSICLAALSACLLAGCDTDEAEDTQGAADRAAETQDTLTGTLDRSFAGEELPQVTIHDPSGAQLDLGATKGRPVLLNLWATWCAPCVAEMPLLDNLAAELGENVQVLTVSADLRGAEAVEPFFAKHEFKHLPQWMDEQGELAMAFGGGAVLPLTIMYDSEGREVWRVIGAYNWGSAQAREAVAEAQAAPDAIGNRAGTSS